MSLLEIVIISCFFIILLALYIFLRHCINIIKGRYDFIDRISDFVIFHRRKHWRKNDL